MLNETLKKEKNILYALESEILASKDYVYRVSVVKHRKVDLSGTGIFVTNCLACNCTCHPECDCGVHDDRHKYKCSVVVPNTDIDKIHCSVCPGKCSWRCHVNNPHKFETYEEEEERRSDELYKRYQEATDKIEANKQIIDNTKKQLKVLENEVNSLIQQVTKYLQDLQEIALRPINMSEVDYINLLIEQERTEGRKGLMERIKVLEGFRKQAVLITKVSNMQVQATHSQSVFELLH